MIDRTPTRPVVPDFAPVPRKHRHDGWTGPTKVILSWVPWTPDRQRAFIDALAETGSVTRAAARINMSAEGAYYLRRSPGAEGFRRAWEAALNHGIQRLADIAIDRAIEGVPVPVYWRGEQVGERRWFNDRLLMFILRHHLPARYGPLAPLPPGTKHPDTLAREQADAHDTEAWLKDRAEALGALTFQHRAKVYAAAEAHAAGDAEAFELLTTQAKALEQAIDGDPRLWSIWAAIKPALEGKDPTKLRPGED